MDQLLTFSVGNETYGFHVEQVSEVFFEVALAHPHDLPAILEGIIDSKGERIPVADLRRCLGLAGAPPGRQRVIVVELAWQRLGLLVDEIQQVISLHPSQYASVPAEVVDDEERNCIEWLAKLEDDLIIVLAPQRLLTEADTVALLALEDQ